MDFEEWLEEYREDKSRSDADWYPNNVQIFEAGQQSKQEKIDELQKRIDTALRNLEDHEGYDDLTHAIKTLKGELK